MTYTSHHLSPVQVETMAALYEQLPPSGQPYHVWIELLPGTLSTCRALRTKGLVTLWTSKYSVRLTERGLLAGRECWVLMNGGGAR